MILKLLCNQAPQLKFGTVCLYRCSPFFTRWSTCEKFKVDDSKTGLFSSFISVLRWVPVVAQTWTCSVLLASDLPTSKNSFFFPLPQFLRCLQLPFFFSFQVLETEQVVGEGEKTLLNIILAIKTVVVLLFDVKHQTQVWLRNPLAHPIFILVTY